MATPSLDEKTAKEVLRQVEFYLGDSNIPRDNFMRNTINSSEDGMVSLSLLCTFKKMKGHLKLADVTPEEVPEVTVQAVAETLRKSTSLKVSEDGKKVGRIGPLPDPEEAIEQLDARTIAASPLPYNVKREDVRSFFGQHAKVTSVRMPFHVTDKRVFCGTALVEFSTEEEAERLLTESFVFEGVQLELKPKKVFDAEREKETQGRGKLYPSTGTNNKNNSNRETDYPKGLLVAFTLKRSSTAVGSEGQNGAEHTVKDGQKSSTSEETETVGEESSDTKAIKSENGDKTSEDPIDKNQPKEKTTAAAYKDDMNVVLREDLKAVFGNFGTIKYVDFKIGEESGYIRYENPEEAQKARTAAVLAEEHGLIVKNFVASLEPVTGDAEREYWSQVRGQQERRRENFGHRGRGGKHFRGGGKHHRSRDQGSGRPNKAPKVAA